MKYTLVILATLIVLLIGALLFPYTGLYNVAATAGHDGLEQWYLNTTSERSIRARADAYEVPGDLTDSTRIRNGAVAFAQMCQTCHGAPGRERSVTGQGLTPTPPGLGEEASAWAPNEIYWILKHGIKMAGMPAYGPTHSDEELWEIVAFVEQLPGMTPDQYASLTAPERPAPDDSTRTGPQRADDGHDHVH